MTPEPSKEEPKGVAPSKADLEKTKEITKGYFSPLIQEDEKPWKYFNEKIAQALAELRAEGERKLKALDNRLNSTESSLAFHKNFTIPDLRKEKSALEERVKLLERACSKTNEEVCQSLGKVLGYPWFKDDQKNFPDATEENGVCVGEHVAESISEEAAKKIVALEERVKALGEDCVQLQQTINCLEMDTVIPKLSEEITRLKAELHEATLRASEYKNEWESALYREQGLKADNEQYWALAKQHQEALKSSQKALGEMKLYHHNAKEEVHRLTSALARAHEALLECEVDIKDSLGVLSKETEEMVKQALSDPIGQIVFEKLKKMGAVVEAARACYEEDDFITENSPGSFERDKKLGEALEALDAKGGS